jgi:hypothetical protein
MLNAISPTTIPPPTASSLRKFCSPMAIVNILAILNDPRAR